MKQCRTCLFFKALTYFAVNKANKDGTANQCKECKKIYDKTYRERNKESIAISKKQCYEKKKEYYRNLNKKWQTENEEHFKQKKAEYARTHKEERRAWFMANPYKNTQYTNNRRARIKYNGGTFTTIEWEMLCAQYNNICLACGKSEITVDHVIALSRGGLNSIDNLQPLCFDCNQKKHTQTIDYRNHK